ncbi:hypothetical protein EDF56_105186 [Novosphingobium sp. PhB165]|uniref:hypothetical protein n=1 Tax=Novosphingobium sp. PhB165 TaxID=2485105 RepID=UPI00104BE72C|nr:hypothetical protein [Novosphingobium sp. PhB165]TCM17842.1 hypothetical protein EDF56_105186 [Novosphingobium sp. PhB165]
MNDHRWARSTPHGNVPSLAMPRDGRPTWRRPDIRADNDDVFATAHDLGQRCGRRLGALICLFVPLVFWGALAVFALAQSL